MQGGPEAVLASFAGMSLVTVAFRELTIEKLSGDPCISHVDDMHGPSDLGSHDHHLNASGLYSLKDSYIWNINLRLHL